MRVFSALEPKAAHYPRRNHQMSGHFRYDKISLTSRHEDRFAPRRLNARCPVCLETFAGTRGNGRDAPFTDIRTTETKPLITAHRAASLPLWDRGWRSLR
jgi:hypothetical protein